MGFFKGFSYFCGGSVQRYFQKILKFGRVAPLLKGDLRDDQNNYRNFHD